MAVSVSAFVTTLEQIACACQAHPEGYTPVRVKLCGVQESPLSAIIRAQFEVWGDLGSAIVDVEVAHRKLFLVTSKASMVEMVKETIDDAIAKALPQVASVLRSGTTPRPVSS